MARTVLITGVSSGIGRLTAELMASRGWQVAGTTRDTSPQKGWAAQHGIALFQLDVTDDKSIAGVVSTVVERLGGIDVLVNNAGYGVVGPLEGTTAEQVEAQISVNLLGPLTLIRHVMPVMRARRDGTIVNVSSIGGRMGSPFASLYHASKFAIEGFTESFRYEASLHGVRLKLIEPGHFKTGFVTRSLQLTAHEAYDKQLDNYMQWVYLEDEKAPAPHPVAEAILRAAEDRSAKLRYPVKGRLILALTALLPDAMWRSLLGGGMTRRPKKSVG